MIDLDVPVAVQINMDILKQTVEIREEGIRDTASALPYLPLYLTLTPDSCEVFIPSLWNSDFLKLFTFAMGSEFKH